MYMFIRCIAGDAKKHIDFLNITISTLQLAQKKLKFSEICFGQKMNRLEKKSTELCYFKSDQKSVDL